MPSAVYLCLLLCGFAFGSVFRQHQIQLDFCVIAHHTNGNGITDTAVIEDILDLDIFDDVLDFEDGLAPNGFLAFFQKIIEWFRGIVEWFKNLFN